VINWSYRELRAIVRLCHFKMQHTGLRLALRIVHPPIRKDYVHTSNKHSTASRAPLRSARFGWVRKLIYSVDGCSIRMAYMIPHLSTPAKIGYSHFHVQIYCGYDTSHDDQAKSK